MVQEITSIISAAAVLIGLIFAGIQARALVIQIRASNTITGTSEIRAVVMASHDVLQLFMAEPELRDYFYENKELMVSAPEYRKVLLIVEMFGDILELGLFTTSKIKATEAADDWRGYATFILQNSHAMRTHLHEHWWPYLTELSNNLPVKPLPGSLAG